MSYLSLLDIQHFRCYEQARLEGLTSGLVVLCGPNGAGKTNVLEAISMFVPGRGLRSVPVGEMQRQDSGTPWALSGKIETTGGTVKIGTGLDPKIEKRIVRINGVTARGQIALSDYLSCLWLTPQMDRLFIEGASARRQFLDRLIFSFDSGHSGRVRRYENALRQRSKLLQEESVDGAWVTGLEAQMAETGVAIAAARLDFVSKLQNTCDHIDKIQAQYFPKVLLQAKGTIEELLQNTPALEVEKMFTYQLQQSRAQDGRTGGAATGPHKSDLNVIYIDKNMPASQCSTGEQKALLIGIILAHAQLMSAERGAPPILLLDEIAAHLDEDRRAVLFDILTALGGQVFMTGTDPVLFSSIAEKAQYFNVEQAEITHENTMKRALNG